MTSHDESKLPKWAQERLLGLRKELEETSHQLNVARSAHVVLMGREWFAIPGPPLAEGDKLRALWYLDADAPMKACSLGPGDVLLIGRSKVLAFEPEARQPHPFEALTK